MIFSSEYPKDSQAHHLYKHWSVFERYGEISFIYKRSIFSYFTGYFFLAILGLMVYRYILGDFEWKYSFILLFPSILLFSEIVTNLPYSIILDDYGLKLGRKRQYALSLHQSLSREILKIKNHSQKEWFLLYFNLYKFALFRGEACPSLLFF